MNFSRQAAVVPARRRADPRLARASSPKRTRRRRCKRSSPTCSAGCAPGSSFGDAISAAPQGVPRLLHRGRPRRRADRPARRRARPARRSTWSARSRPQTELKSALTYPIDRVLPRDRRGDHHGGRTCCRSSRSFYTSLARAPAAADAHAARLHQLHDELVVADRTASSIAVVVVGFAVLGGQARQGAARRDSCCGCRRSASSCTSIAVERFCRVLATLVHTGVPLPDAVQVSADSTNNRVFQAKLATVREAMMRGEGLARPIQAVGHLPAGRAPDDPRRREHRLARHAARQRGDVLRARAEVPS